jgi:hypothetical protein
MEDPWSRVIGTEANGDIVTSHTSSDDVATDGVRIVVGRASSTSHDCKLMLWDPISFNSKP